MRRRLILALTLLGASLTWVGASSARPQAPEFPTRDPRLWINSAPLSMADLRGLVVLIEVWTYG
jgi:hypothetical protein